MVTMAKFGRSARRLRGEKPKAGLPIKHLILGATILVIVVYVSGFIAVVQRMDANNPDLVPPPKVKKMVSDALQHQTPPKEKVQISDITIGYAVTITGCGSDPITEGAAVLKHAVHLVSSQGTKGGRYNYQMYAIYHPDGEACALPLKDLGFTLLKRETPVAVKDIQGDFLREKIEKNGCCGEKELVKLEAYTLIQHPIVVHLDLDVLILKPMDALFDWMLVDPQQQLVNYDTTGIPIMWPKMEVPPTPNAFFTRDCKSNVHESCKRHLENCPFLWHAKKEEDPYSQLLSLSLTFVHFLSLR